MNIKSELDRPVATIKGIGPTVVGKLRILGVQTVRDLVLNFPRRYDDYSHVVSIKHMMPGTVTIRARITSYSGRYARRGMHITEALASDETGSIKLVWFNQAYRLQSFKRDAEYYISGEFGMKSQRLSITSPTIELVSDFPVHTARIVPIYRETKGLKSNQIRRYLRQVLPEMRLLAETLPRWVIKEFGFPSYAEAVESMHFPPEKSKFDTARYRLGFEEVFQLSLASLLNRYELLQETTVEIAFDEKLARLFVSHLPFQLTNAQRRVVWQIYQDMARSQPMNRLVEGDVGSGKTVVAAMAAVMAMNNGYQVVLMAPTELLARQHADTIYELLKPLGLADRVGLLVGGLKAAEKKHVHAAIKAGDIHFVIGTQALFQDKVSMHNLGLVIVDEQHRFGVSQRKSLQAKAGIMPHVLSLTATPIPRSLALTLYGELDISVLDVKPAGRVPIHTKLCVTAMRKDVLAALELELAAGRQAFVVCPLIEESEAMAATSVQKSYADMQKHFRHRRVAMLHGKMTSDEKDMVMQRFANGETDILVSTTVIEVGVNVPNATFMLVENAERFGLAQIHQLRGRVGRSTHQGYCYLMLGDNMPPGKRLRALETSNDGFALAEMDLEIRGPGAIYGTTQHGALDLKIASLTDVQLIAAARNTAQEFIDKGEDLVQYTELYAAVNKLRAVTNLN